MPRTKQRVAGRVVVLLGAVLVICSCGGTQDLEVRNQANSAGGTSPNAGSPGAITATAGDSTVDGCEHVYSPAAIKEKQFAFDGVVTEIGERADPQNPTARFGTAVFSIGEWYKGGGSTELTLQSTLPLREEAVPITEGPDLRVGSRYLVSGNGGFVGTCGFTRIWSQREEGEWKKALKS